MPKLLVVCGHGDGDSGATYYDRTEFSDVQRLAWKIKELGGDPVILGDMRINWYREDHIRYIDFPLDTQIVELHRDSYGGGARGAHIIITSRYEPDAFDVDLANRLSTLFEGRAEIIQRWDQLQNAETAADRGYGYRLAECGFIDNDGDNVIFDQELSQLASEILAAFGIESAVETLPPFDVDALARDVINGVYGNGAMRRDALGDRYDVVQARVNQLLA